MTKSSGAAVRAARVLAAVGVAATLLPGTASAAADHTAPTATPSVVEGANPGRQHVAGTTVYLNPTATGSFTVRVAAADKESGVASVTFPAMLGAPSTVDRAAPFARTYTWPVSAAAPGTANIVVKNGAGLSRTTSVAVRTDGAPPQAGATVSYATGRQPAGPVDIAVTAGPGDTGSGLAGRALQRRVALPDTGCALGTTTPVATGVTSGTVTDASVTAGGCYSYRLVESDHVGNHRVIEAGAAPRSLNRAPVAVEASATTTEGSATGVTLTGTDPDGDPLTYRVETGPANGTLTGSGTSYVYTPRAHFSGTDQVRFSVSDGISSSSASVALEVGAVNDAPVAQPARVTVDEDGRAAVTLAGTDADGDPLTYVIVDAPTRGELTGTAPSLTYVPAPNYFGSDTFTFQVSDGHDTSATVPVEISVTAVNDAPVAADATVEGEVGTAVPFTLAGTDVDGDQLTYRVVTPPSGTLLGTGTGAELSYVASAAGADRLTYTVSDGVATSAPATVTFSSKGGSSPVGLTKGIISQGAPAVGHDYVNHVTGGTAIHWKDLESADQVFTGTAWARIDTLIANPRVDGIRLRVYGGRYAPTFVKKLGGPAVSGSGYDCSVSGGVAVHNPYDNTGGCVPRFWQDAAMDEYEELMREIARRYGNNPKLTEIVSSACMTTYAEPFYRAHSDAASNARLWTAGLNRATDLACQDRSMTINTTVFPNRATSLAINPWEIIVDPAVTKGGVVRDWTAMHQFAEKWKARLGNRLVLQNNGWGENDGCAAGKTAETNVYCYLAEVADPKGYQSETWSRLGDTLGGNSLAGWYRALENAIAAGACAVESTDNQYRQADPVTMAEYDRRLEANC